MCSASKGKIEGAESLNMEQEQRLHFLLKKLNLAQKLYRLIEEGDRIAVGVSSGKDSLTLLLLLQYFQKHNTLSFELGAVHIEPDFQPGHQERGSTWRNSSRGISFLSPL